MYMDDLSKIDTAQKNSPGCGHGEHSIAVVGVGEGAG